MSTNGSKKKDWIQGAVKKPGALRAIALKMKLIKNSKDKLSNKDLAVMLKKAKKTMIVYDIIYDPIKTTLLKNSEEIGLKTINGLRMNLVQAVLAYRYTNRTSLSIEEIYNAMN